MRKSKAEITWYLDSRGWYLYALKHYETGKLMLKVYEGSHGSFHGSFEDVGYPWMRVNQSDIAFKLADCIKVNVTERVLVQWRKEC